MSGIHFFQSAVNSYNPPAAGTPEVVVDSLEQYINPLISSTADQSGNGRNATLVGGLSLDGNSYYDIDTSGKYINSGWSQTLTGEFTWAAWFNLGASGLSSVPTNIITNYITSTTPFSIFGVEGTNYTNPGGVYGRSMRSTSNNEASKIFIETSDMRGDGWHYWAWAHDCATGNYNLYKDGSLVTSGTDGSATGDYTSGQNQIFFGGHLNRFFTNSKGGAVQLYSKKLSDEEVLQNYNALKADYGL